MADGTAELVQLLELGIDLEEALIALERCNQDVTQAANYIFSGGLDNCPMEIDPSSEATDTTHFNSPRPSSPKENPSGVNPGPNPSDTGQWDVTPTPPNNDLTTSPQLPSTGAIVPTGHKGDTGASEWFDPTSPLDRRRDTSSTPVGLRPMYDAPLLNSLLQAYLFVPGIAQLLWRVVAPNFEWPSSEGYWNSTGQTLPSEVLLPLRPLVNQVQPPTTASENGVPAVNEAQSRFIYELARLYGFMIESKRAYVDSTCVLYTMLGGHPSQESKGLAEALVRYLDEFTHQMANQQPSQWPENVAGRGSIPRLRSVIQLRPSNGAGRPEVGKELTSIDLPRLPSDTRTVPTPDDPSPSISLYKLLDAVANPPSGPQWVLQSVADVLYLRLPPSDSSAPRIKLEKTLWLDRYLSKNMSQADAIRLLEQQAQGVGNQLSPTSSLDLMSTSQKILDTLATNTVLLSSPYGSPTNEGTDQTSSARLKSQITQTQAFLARRQLIRSGQQQAAQQHMQPIQRQIAQILDDPALKQTSYHLHAAVFARNNASDVMHSWVYIRRSHTQDPTSCSTPSERTGWWCIHDDVVKSVSDSELEAEDTRQLVNIIYISDKLHRESIPELPPSLADNVAEDNSRFIKEMQDLVSHSTAVSNEVPGTTEPVVTSPSHEESLKHNQPEEDTKKQPIQTGDSPSTKDSPTDTDTLTASSSSTHSGQNLPVSATTSRPLSHQPQGENTDGFHTAAVNRFINEAVALENDSPTILRRIDIFMYRAGLHRTIISFWSQFTTDMASPTDETQQSLWQLRACVPYRPCYEEYRDIVQCMIGGFQAALAEEYYEAIQTFKHAYTTNLEWTRRYATLRKETDHPTAPTLADQPLSYLSKQGEIVDNLRYCFQRLNHAALRKARLPAFRTRGLEDGLSVVQLLVDTARVVIPLTLPPGHTNEDESFVDKLGKAWFTIHDTSSADYQPWTLQQSDLINRIVDAYTTWDVNPVDGGIIAQPPEEGKSYVLPHGSTGAPSPRKPQEQPLSQLHRVYEMYQTRMARARADWSDKI
ncbi:hypothetical protein IWQ62_003854 [Dispira parvispora]|uniref:UBA domain-containing protein n=1 Tax=Dispira parvispora TaxID=1520584 RepID=A0A9W8AN19_9FUNG|nr:hypothetical protein IWQ62_003854 [Dispira parvispora]